jgi:hypothetical protein
LTVNTLYDTILVLNELRKFLGSVQQHNHFYELVVSMVVTGGYAH